LLLSKNVVCRALAIKPQAEQSLIFYSTHLYLPKMVNGITGTPIWSKQTLSVALEGGMHFVVSLMSGSCYSLVKFPCQYPRALVTRQPFPEIGLKQKSLCLMSTPLKLYTSLAMAYYKIKTY
jgi:hypothetical protein